MPAANRVTITGVVRTPEGKAVPSATVMITGDSPSHPDIAAITDTSGRYRLTGLTPGTYTLQVNVTGWTAQQARVEALPGVEAQLDFVLRK
jgi:hypothetical protein